MKTASQIFAELQIPQPRNRGDTQYVARCPRCSDGRSTKEHRKQKCLAVNVDNRGVRWRCHHCDWSGGQFYDAPRKPDAESKPVVVKDTADDTRQRHKIFAQQIWRESVPLPGTLGERYLIEHRKIDVTGIDLTHVLRWHKSDRMVVALMTDAATNEPLGVHRTFLGRDGAKLKRLMLGPAGVIRLWPDEAVEQALVIVEGIETVLAAALGVELHGTLLQPAWVAGNDKAIANFPILPGFECLTILVDNDASQAGQAAAKRCAERWTEAERDVIRLTPRAAKDFNDVVRGAAA